MTTTVNQSSLLPQATEDGAEDGAIAIIGMAGRFPAAPDVEQYWQMLREGREGVTFFSEEQLLGAGVPLELVRDPAYVPARATLQGAEEFDAEFFGFSPREAELMDPQFRVFLECAYGACESAGYARLAARTGVFAGMGASAYLLHLARQLDSADSAPILNALILNDKDYLATLTGYKLDLRGPNMTVQTACSTSLVAVHVAAQSLLAGECDVALAGAVSVSFPQEIGYRHDANGVLSSDGHCRAFDARGEGIVEGNGVGVVVLKRLDDALRAGDSIRAIIRGSAINNDGSGRIGYTAPGVEGQTNVVLEALAMAGVPASSIGFVEAHGTGTKMGDPIEVAALSRAHGKRSTPCVLGSVKSNIGHLGAASGVAGLIKAVLALEHGEIPPTLHFERSNPSLDLAAAGFEVSSKLVPWPAIAGRRRAAVSSFGIGGTNAHVVLEQAPERRPASSETSASAALLVWSGRTAEAADAMTQRLAASLSAGASAPALEDVAFTLHAGRRRFEHRRALACRSIEGARQALESPGWPALSRGTSPEQHSKVVFLLPGLGDQYPGMAREPYRDFPMFRAALDRYAEAFLAELGVEVRELLLAAPTTNGRVGRAPDAPGDGLAQTRVAQPALFAMTCALADCLAAWGISPDLMIGHSFGEYTAAYLSGVFSFDDAIKLVSARAKLLDALEPGALLSVLSSAREVEPYLNDKIYLSAVNAPEICTLAGSPTDIDELAARLSAAGVVTMRLAATHAFHSPMMASAMQPLERVITELAPRPPRIPYVSNVTGELVRGEDATSPQYWARHLRETVRFSSGIRAACLAPHQVLLELGPGVALGSFARMSGVDPTRATLVSCVPGRLEARDGECNLLDAVGKLWCLGIEADLTRITPQGRRVPLPTYPFQRQRYVLSTRSLPMQRPRLPSVEPQACGFRLLETSTGLAHDASGPTLVVHDDSDAAVAIVDELARHSSLTRVTLGSALEQHADGTFTIDPTRPSDWSALLRELDARGSAVEHVVFALGRARERGGSDLETAAALGTFLALRAALKGSRSLRLTVLGNGLMALNESEAVDPARAALVGAARVVAQESSALSVRLVDFAALGDEPGQTPTSLVAEATFRMTEALLALRGRQRFVPSLTDLVTPPAPRNDSSSSVDAPRVTVVLDEPAGAGAAIAEALRRAGEQLELVSKAADLADALEQIEATHAGATRLVWPALQDVALKQLDDMNAATVLHPTLSSQLAAVESALSHSKVGECWLLLPLSGLSGGRGHFERAALANHAAALAHQANRRAACRFYPVFVERDLPLGPVARLLRHPAPVACGSTDLPELVAASFDYRPPSTAVRAAASPATDSTYVAPDSELEVAIVGIWEDLLGLARVGVNDNFFEFGGQSLMGLQLLSRIKAAYGVELTLRDLFDAPTVAEQAFRVESALLTQIESEFPAVAGQGDAA